VLPTGSCPGNQCQEVLKKTKRRKSPAKKHEVDSNDDGYSSTPPKGKFKEEETAAGYKRGKKTMGGRRGLNGHASELCRCENQEDPEREHKHRMTIRKGKGVIGKDRGCNFCGIS